MRNVPLSEYNRGRIVHIFQHCACISLSLSGVLLLDECRSTTSQLQHTVRIPVSFTGIRAGTQYSKYIQSLFRSQINLAHFSRVSIHIPVFNYCKPTCDICILSEKIIFLGRIIFTISWSSMQYLLNIALMYDIQANTNPFISWPFFQK